MSGSYQESQSQDEGPNLPEVRCYGNNDSEPDSHAEKPCRPTALSSQQYLSGQILQNLRSTDHQVAYMFGRNSFEGFNSLNAGVHLTDAHHT
ncbi:hypothetical protein MKMG_02052 [Methanogenium sp. MK-MG]|nr:hypothetical protein MKMG_02052 [Methanogenium sp. MK-MG]